MRCNPGINYLINGVPILETEKPPVSNPAHPNKKVFVPQDNFLLLLASQLTTSRGNRCSKFLPKRIYLRCWSGNGLPSPDPLNLPSKLPLEWARRNAGPTLVWNRAEEIESQQGPASPFQNRTESCIDESKTRATISSEGIVRPHFLIKKMLPDPTFPVTPTLGLLF